MSKLRMIQVGAGGWGQSWLQFLHESSDWELAGLVSRGGESLADAKAQWQIPAAKCCPNLGDALTAEADAVLIVAPPHLHVPLAREALAAGKHVLCEKPFSDSFAAAKELVAYAKTTGKQLAISQNFRYREGLWQLKAAANAMGPVDSLTVGIYEPQDPMPSWRQHFVDSFLLEIAIHHVDMARFLLGADAKSVRCQAWNPSWSISDGPASAEIIVEFKNGAVLGFSGSWAARGKPTAWEGEWRIQYEGGIATWEGGQPHFETPSGDPCAAPPVEGLPAVDRAGVLKAFAESVRRGVPFPTNGEENLQSLAIIFAAIQSAQEKRQVLVDEIMAE